MNIFKFIKSTSFFKQVAIVVVVSLLLVFVLKWWLGFTTNHDQKIEVPDLNKMELTEAAKKLQEVDLTFIVIDSTRYNPEYPNKSVIEQNPEAGDFVKEKRKIYLTVNPSKYNDVVLPDLNGRTKRQAITHLLSIGFRIGESFYVRDIGKDVVRGMKYNGSNLKPGEKRPKNSVIDLVLGDGKE
ncbi:Serine/threonine-protein kinase PK-1 [Polaribacter huanghezhanensis]|uniref:PASTA domain-containing protein n=1 Tax=Polaribacter huanghezhanensis TaxID=1354726 RepID=UPI0026486388|nr:PASTA domain-containing protein [Polaribacter huanghezhanensis]WKD84808.1 Serine/threonine-protein kinase PK-1 [Polaribacter huanghezhanensis]